MMPSELYRIGEFEVDACERRLSRNGETIPLMPKAYDVLLALIRDGGRLVSKQRLLETVWPDCFVEEGILAVHISSLRKALGGGTPECQYIETVPRSGYRFVAGVERLQAGAMEHRAVHPEAVYELFGQGRSHLLAASPAGVVKAVSSFRAAIELDPMYAPAHAGLALAYYAQAELRIVSHAQAFDDAKGSAIRALALDDSCADAHTALGAVQFLGEWNWRAAERSLNRALELNPDHTEALLLYGRLLEAVGEIERGLEMKQRALERDPLSPMVHLQIAISYWHLRKYDAMIQWATKSLDLDPKHMVAREHIAAAWLKKGDFERYLEEVIMHAEVAGAPIEFIDGLKRAYAEGGQEGFRRYGIACMQQQTNAPALALAIHYGEAGDLDAAFHHLQRAIDARDPCLVHLAVGPQWDSLRADPRFSSVLARMGLKSSADARC